MKNSMCIQNVSTSEKLRVFIHMNQSCLKGDIANFVGCRTGKYRETSGIIRTASIYRGSIFSESDREVKVCIAVRKVKF